MDLSKLTKAQLIEIIEKELPEYRKKEEPKTVDKWERSYTIKHDGKTFITEINRATGEFRTHEATAEELKKKRSGVFVKGTGIEHIKR